MARSATLTREAPAGPADPAAAGTLTPPAADRAAAGRPWRQWLRHPLTLATGAAALCGLAGWALQRAGRVEAALVAYGLAYLAGGWHATRAGLAALREGRIDVDLLMVLAAAGAAALGHWHEGAVLLFLFSLSNALQQLALDRARSAVQALMALHPERALRRTAEGEQWVPVEALAPGDLIVVRPGDRVPVDGVVVRGTTTVDQSPITGESRPVPKEPDDPVFAGSINHNGVIEVRVTRPAAESTLARIARLVERAQQEKAAFHERIERFEQRYAQGVLVAVAAVAVVPVALGAPPELAVYRALTLLVVASPCAIAIAAPAAFLAAMSAGARSGVLIKGGRFLERLAAVEIVALDKTGTLTTGQPRVSDVVPYPGHDEREVLRLAAALEAHADHPVARAILAAAAERGVAPLPEAEAVQVVAGRGVRGRVGGREAFAGSLAFAAAWWGQVPAAVRLAAEALVREGKGAVVVGTDRPVGVIGLEDAVRPEAAPTLRRLRALGVRRIVMLTGDDARVAQAVAARLGIDEVHAQLLPEDKVRLVERLAREGTVAMVGDGINDAPALARGHVGVAMGAAGSDAALESADVVLMGDRLDRLAYAIGLGMRTRRVVLQGLALAVAVIAVLGALALAGRIPLAWGVVGHEGSTLLVALNGLRLLWATADRTARLDAAGGRRVWWARPNGRPRQYGGDRSGA